MKQIIAYIFFSYTVSLLSGCGEETESEDLRTGQLEATYVVTKNVGGQAEITAGFTYLSGVVDGIFPVTERVTLTGQDRLTVEAAGETSGFTRDDSNGALNYSANLNVGDEETDFIITLDRPSRSESFVSTVTLAPAMELFEPADNQTYSISDSINLAWSPVMLDRNSKICAKTTCIKNSYYHDLPFCSPTDETGEYLFIISDFFDRISSYSLTSQNSCGAEIFLSRSETGNISPKFSYHSRITAKRESSKNIVININL